MTRTTTTTAKPRRSRAAPKDGSLEQRAMLVDLTVRQWTAAKNDKKVSDEVAESHNSDRNMGHYYKQLMGKEALEKVRRIGNSAFNDHYVYTLPWLDSGSRILSAEGYFKYMEKMRYFKTEYEAAVEEFLQSYEAHVEEAKVRLNGMFRSDDYPLPSEIRAKFSFDVQVLPLPVAGDFRVSIGREEVARIKSQLDAAQEGMMKKAMQDVATRITLVVDHMAERLRAYNGTQQGSFRDTLVSNISAMIDLIPVLNVAADPRIEEIRQEMVKLTQTPAAELRLDENARSHVADEADAILEKLRAFI